MTNCSTVASIVTMLDARTLKVLATTPVGDSPQDDLLVDERNQRVYVSTIDGVEVLDARTGRRLVRIPLQAHVLAIDEAANRVFLADSSSDLLLLLSARCSRSWRVYLQSRRSPRGPRWRSTRGQVTCTTPLHPRVGGGAALPRRYVSTRPMARPDGSCAAARSVRTRLRWRRLGAVW